MKELIAYLGEARTGRLVLKDNGNLQFRYDDEYRGPALSQSLPVQREAHPHDLCRAFFGGLLIEGAARQTASRQLGVSIENDFALLERFGGDCAGAISLLPAEIEPANEQHSQPLPPEELDERIANLPARPLGIEGGTGVRMSLAGAQPKLPVIFNDSGFAIPLNSSTPTTHLIKPEPEAWPGFVDNEAFCMALARKSGLETASVSKLVSSSGTPCLLVERYDRDLDVTPVRRLHQEDFCQALGRPSERKYQDEGGPAIAECIELIRDSSAVPAADISAFWRALAFNWIIGNCDAHAKNFSLLYTGNAPSLAPLYDLVSTVQYEGVTDRLAMTIGKARHIGEVGPDSWVEQAESAGVSPRFARETVESMIVETSSAARELLDGPEHSNELARSIAARILSIGS